MGELASVLESNTKCGTPSRETWLSSILPFLSLLFPAFLYLYAHLPVKQQGEGFIRIILLSTLLLFEGKHSFRVTRLRQRVRG